MHVNYLLLARESSVDRDRNTISVFDLFEDIQIETATKVNQIQIPIHVVGLFEKDDTDNDTIVDTAVLEVFSPDGKSALIQDNIPIKLETNVRYCRVRSTLLVPINLNGVYTFTLKLRTQSEVEKSTKIRIQVVDSQLNAKMNKEVRASVSQ